MKIHRSIKINIFLSEIKFLKFKIENTRSKDELMSSENDYWQPVFSLALNRKHWDGCGNDSVGTGSVGTGCVGTGRQNEAPSRDEHSIPIPKLNAIFNTNSRPVPVKNIFFFRENIFWGWRDAHPLTLKSHPHLLPSWVRPAFFVPSFFLPYATYPWFSIKFVCKLEHTRIPVPTNGSEMHKVLQFLAHFRTVCGFSCFPMNSGGS